MEHPGLVVGTQGLDRLVNPPPPPGDQQNMQALARPIRPIGMPAVKVKVSLRKTVASQLRNLFDLSETDNLPAEHVNEALLFLFEEMKCRPDLKARFWQHMSEAKRRREEIHVGPAAKRQRRYRERLKEKARRAKEKDSEGMQQVDRLQQQADDQGLGQVSLDQGEKGDQGLSSDPTLQEQHLSMESLAMPQRHNI